RIFGPLVSPRISALTVNRPASVVTSPSLTTSTVGSVTEEPTSPATLSTSRTSPTETFCCLPPQRTIAYTAEPFFCNLLAGCAPATGRSSPEKPTNRGERSNGRVNRTHRFSRVPDNGGPVEPDGTSDAGRHSAGLARRERLRPLPWSLSAETASSVSVTLSRPAVSSAATAVLSPFLDSFSATAFSIAILAWVPRGSGLP